MRSIWADLEGAEFEGGENPRFRVRFAGREACVYFNRPISKGKIVRTILEGTGTRFQLKYADLVERIADDLLDNFGDGQYLVWSPERARACTKNWRLRLLRNALANLEVGDVLTRDELEAVLDEIYVVGPVLTS